MDLKLAQAIRTQIRPGDLRPHFSLPRTQLRPEDLQRQNAGTHTAIGPADLQRHVAPALSPEQARHDQLTRTAQKWVGQTFFGTLLKQARNSPFKSELFSGGRGGEAFSALYDQYLAERMARASGRQLSASIVKHIERARRRAVDNESSSPAAAPAAPALLR